MCVCGVEIWQLVVFQCFYEYVVVIIYFQTPLNLIVLVALQTRKNGFKVRFSNVYTTVINTPQTLNYKLNFNV